MFESLRRAAASPIDSEPKKPGRITGNKDFLYQQIASVIRGRIHSGQYVAGDRLPSNDELSAQMEVNRLTIRRAITSLIEEGLLITQPSRGTFVAELAAPTASIDRPAGAEAAEALPQDGPAPREGRLRTTAVFSEVFFPDYPGAYHMEFLNEVRRELAEIGCTLVIPPELSLSALSGYRQADGIMLLGPFATALVPEIPENRAVVLVDDYQPALSVDSVVVDNMEVGRLAASHLRSCGHDRVAVVTGDPGQPSIQERLRGFQSAWGETASVCVVDGEFQKHVAAERVRAVLAESPETTALFCMNDDMAAGALDALKELGRTDVGVVGCDDVSFAAMLTPALTTIRIPRNTMARLAVRCLQGWRAARNDGIPPIRQSVSPELVVRASTPSRR